MLHHFRFSRLLALAVALITLGIISSSGSANAAIPSQIVSALGVAHVQGQDVLVDVVVVVPPGENARDAALAALASQGARPFHSANLGSAGFTATGLVWDNLPVVQNYNPSKEPASLGGAGQIALTNTHTTWDGVATSSFNINFGTLTPRCPSLVRECPGRQTFDGNNDVAWLKLKGNVLGVTWFGTSTDEADMALNVSFDWADDGVSHFDAQTVFLHENGHVVGLGHSNDAGSVMQPNYHGVDRDLGTDDQEGATYLYDSSPHNVSGTVTDDAATPNPIEGATVVLEGTSLQATTDVNGNYTISGVPDPVTYDVTASAGGFDSATTSRLTVDGSAVNIDFTLTPTGEEENGGGGGPPSCVPKKFCP